MRVRACVYACACYQVSASSAAEDDFGRVVESLVLLTHAVAAERHLHLSRVAVVLGRRLGADSADILHSYQQTNIERTPKHYD